jgi:hypothetical protein
MESTSRGAGQALQAGSGSGGCSHLVSTVSLRISRIDPGECQNSVLVDRHFASIDDLEDAQPERCVVLQARLDLVRSTTGFRWWLQRIKKRQGPRQKSLMHPFMRMLYQP